MTNKYKKWAAAIRPDPVTPGLLLKSMRRISDPGGSQRSKAHLAPISLNREFPRRTLTWVCMCACLHFSLCVLGQWWYLPSLSISPLPALAAASFLPRGGKGSPFVCREGSYPTARQLPSKTFCQEARVGGRKNPNRPVLQAGCYAAPPPEALLGRVEERRRLKLLDKVIKVEIPTWSPTPSPGLQDLAGERLSATTVRLGEERERKGE